MKYSSSFYIYNYFCSIMPDALILNPKAKVILYNISALFGNQYVNVLFLYISMSYFKENLVDQTSCPKHWLDQLHLQYQIIYICNQQSFELLPWTF